MAAGDLRHLRTAWDVDRTVVLEEDRLVLVRFSRHELFAAAASPPGPGVLLHSAASPTRSQRLTTSDYGSYLDVAAMDVALVSIAPRVRNFCVVYAVNTLEVPDFDDLYELGEAYHMDSDDDAGRVDNREPFAIIFFFRGKRLLVDVGSGNNNKLTRPVEDEAVLIGLITQVYKDAVKGHGLASFNLRSLR